eukprot:94359_1
MASEEYECKKQHNQVIITILKHHLDTRSSNNHAPQLPLPYIKAMKAVADMDFEIKTEYHAKEIRGIDPYLVDIIVDGLKRVGKYRVGLKNTEIRPIQGEQEQRSNSTRNRRIRSAYIPRENTATRAMFIVLVAIRIRNITKE